MKNTKMPEYRAWTNMKNRCRNKSYRSYHRYGGRGIKVCKRWANSFANFLADMGHRPSPKHSIDRINNDGNYEPGNCRWATHAMQQANRPRMIRDLAGQKFGRLTAISLHPKDHSQKAKWHCVCECGGTTISCSSNLTMGKATSCGCKSNWDDQEGRGLTPRRKYPTRRRPTKEELAKEAAAGLSAHPCCIRCGRAAMWSVRWNRFLKQCVLCVEMQAIRTAALKTEYARGGKYYVSTAERMARAALKAKRLAS